MCFNDVLITTFNNCPNISIYYISQLTLTKIIESTLCENKPSQLIEYKCKNLEIIKTTNELFIKNIKTWYLTYVITKSVR